VVQAVVGTVAVFGGMAVLYKTGVLRATPRFVRWVVGALIGVVALSLLNLVFAMFGHNLGLVYYAPTQKAGLLAIGFSVLCVASGDRTRPRAAAGRSGGTGDRSAGPAGTPARQRSRAARPGPGHAARPARRGRRPGRSRGRPRRGDPGAGPPLSPVDRAHLATHWRSAPPVGGALRT